MTIEVPPLLQQSARAAARELAQRWLQRAKAAAARLNDEADSEALHDFRVALRRLRATERAYRAQLDDVFGKKQRRRLRRLAAGTGAARDAEVQLQWVDRQRGALRAHQRSGWHFMRAWLLTRISEEYVRVRAEAPVEFDGLERRLHEALDAPLPEGPAPLFVVVCATALHSVVGELSEGLAALDSIDNDIAIHELRLVMKRARYLLDPIAEAIDATALSRAFADWQDRLGTIHDLQVLGSELVAAAHAAGMHRYGGLVEQALRDAQAPSRDRRDERAGLIALAQLAAAQQRQQRDELQSALRNGEAEQLIEALAAAVAALGAIHPVTVPAVTPISGAESES